MIYWIQLIYQMLLPPGGILFILFSYILFEKKKYKKWNRPLIVIVSLFYFLSTGMCADMLAKPLEQMYSPTKDIQGDVLLMMCSGANQYIPDVDGMGAPAPIMAKTMMVTAQLYHKTSLPILICGGGSHNSIIKEAEVAERDLKNIGIPSEKIYIEKESRNTAEGAKEAAKIFKEKGWRHPILLAAALHTPRSLALFQRERIDIRVYPTYYRRSVFKKPFTVSKFIPSAANLDDSAMAIKEYLGILAIKLRLN